MFWVVLIFDTVEYSNCLMEAYICFSRKQVNKFYNDNYKAFKMGHIDILEYRYEFNDSDHYPIQFY